MQAGRREDLPAIELAAAWLQAVAADLDTVRRMVEVLEWIAQGTHHAAEDYVRVAAETIQDARRVPVETKR